MSKSVANVDTRLDRQDFHGNSESLNMWLTIALSPVIVTWVPSVLVAQLMQHVGELCERVLKNTPIYEHYFNDDTMNRKLLKSRLLHFGGREALTHDCVGLFTLLQEIPRVSDKYKLNRASHEDELAEATSIFEAGRRVLKVLAGVQILLELSGAQQKDEATKFVDKHSNAGIPASLLEALRSLRTSGAKPAMPVLADAAEI